METYCIYEIINILNNKRYIGKTKHFEKRVLEHLTQLRNNRHHCQYLQHAYNLYGESAFVFNIISQNIKEEDANLIEKLIINCNYDDLYNISKQSCGGDNISYHPNRDNIIKRMSEANKNRFIEHPELIENLRTKMSGEGNPMYGKHHTEETRKIISEKSKNRIYTEEDRQIISEQTRKRYKENPKYREHISEGLKKRYKNPENRRITSESSKRNWQKPGYRDHMKKVMKENAKRYYKPVYGDGIIYESVTKAAIDQNVKIGSIINRCKSKNFPNWYYIEENNN